MQVRRIAATGAAVGLAWGLAVLGIVGVVAPAFFEPAAAAAGTVLAALVLAGVLAALSVTLRGARDRVRASAVLASAVPGALAGLVVSAWDAPSAALMGAGLVVGAVVGGTVGLALARPRVRHVATAAAAAIAAVVLAVRSTAPAAAAGGRIVVVGVDGGSWRVLDPLLARGELPNLARLMREGVHGVLQSEQPSTSSVLWTTIATGRAPAEHGIHDFYATQNDDLRAARFWEVASAHGETVGIFQWLMTWPPDPLTGFIVPGWLARDPRTHPAELEWIKAMELRMQHRRGIPLPVAAHTAARAVGEGLRFASAAQIVRDGTEAVRLEDGRATYRAGRYAQLALVGDVFLGRYRRHRPAVAAVVFYGSDALSHAYWKYHEPGEAVPAGDVAAYGDTIREYYRRVDAFLARLLETVGDDTTVLIVSDHGFRAAEERQLALGSTALLAALGEGERFTAHTVNREVYLTHRHAGTPDASADVARVADVCRAIALDGEPVMDVEVDPATSITLVLRRGTERRPASSQLRVGERSMRLGELVTLTTWSGVHEDAGIVIARGPGIRAGERLEHASIRDVAPTILTLLGYPVAEDMDGRVLTEAFVQPPEIRTVASWDAAMPRRRALGHADGELEERLRALGYVR